MAADVRFSSRQQETFRQQKSSQTNANEALSFSQHETFVRASCWYAAAEPENGSRL
jgi:hypothetical protein